MPPPPHRWGHFFTSNQSPTPPFPPKHLPMKPLLIGIGGSSGSIYAKVLLDRVRAAYTDAESHLVKIIVSGNGRYNWKFELGNEDYLNYGFEVIGSKEYHPVTRQAAADMIIAPCSMGLISRVAHGMAEDLISRCMDRALQFRKHGVLIFRDKPISPLHSRNIVAIQRAGGLVIPATPSFYTGRESVEDLARSVVDRALDHIGVPVAGMYRWGETADARLGEHPMG